ncbi:MAG: hypothetical protein L0J71_07410, partial [Bifidobacterium crudilactis]|nr:hypothetical protein [Bifidobacterium crudilactis]
MRGVVRQLALVSDTHRLLLVAPVDIPVPSTMLGISSLMEHPPHECHIKVFDASVAHRRSRRTVKFHEPTHHSPETGPSVEPQQDNGVG